MAILRSSFSRHCILCLIRRQQASTMPQTCADLPMKKSKPSEVSSPSVWSRPELDFDFILNPKNRDLLFKNIQLRKRVGDIDKVHELWQKIQQLLNGESSDVAGPSSANELWNNFYSEATSLPNLIHPAVPEGSDNIRIVETVGQKPPESKAPREAETIAERFSLLYMTPRGSGEKGYALVDGLACLQRALVRYFVNNLVNKHGFKLVLGPDILESEIVKRCGLVDKDLCYNVGLNDSLNLSGTSEVSMAYYVAGSIIDQSELPLKLISVSRCFRPEIGKGYGRFAGGLYRVHDFTKVEMFIVTANETGLESESSFEELVQIQRELYNDLNLYFRIVEMPSEELGAPTIRKWDLEAWMPYRQFFGELCSTSNCTDFQSRRLFIRYRNSAGRLKFVHTLNGTACAIPRTLIALIEQKRTSNNTVPIPTALQPYFKTPLLGKRRKPYPIQMLTSEYF